MSTAVKTQKKLEEKKETANSKVKNRVREGVVVSDKMDKTVVVAVHTIKKHPKYLKRYTFTKRYKVHDPENRFKKGDKVSFVACRPISKEKKWKVL